MTKTNLIAAACTALALSFGTAAVAPANAKSMHKHMMHKKGMSKGKMMNKGGMQGDMGNGGMQGDMGNGGMQGGRMQGGGMQGGAMQGGQNNGM